MPGRVFLSYFVDSRADVLFQVLSAIYDLYDISDRYVAYISRYKRQFLYALFSERYFRDISEGCSAQVVLCNTCVIFIIYPVENVIDYLYDGLFSHQLIEDRLIHDFRYVCIVYVEQVRFERSVFEQFFRCFLDYLLRAAAVFRYVDYLFDRVYVEIEQIAYDER